MKGALLYRDRPGLTLETVADPVAGPGEVLIKIEACGVCGTDVHLVEKHIPAKISPVIPGHEICGTIAALGPDVQGYSTGERVLVFPQIFCGECYACQAGREELCARPQILGIDTNGGFAEYISVPKRILLKAPSGIPPLEAALFAESVGVAYHAIFERGQLCSGETVLVMGAGGLGTGALKLLAPQAAKVIVADTGPAALKRAESLGADLCVDPVKSDLNAKIKDFTNKNGVDLALDFVGKKESVTSAYRSLKKGGRLVLAGVSQERIDFGPLIGMVASGRSILGSFGFSRKSAAGLLAYAKEHNLRFQDSVSASYSLGEVGVALERLQRQDQASVRLIIEPGRNA